MSEMNRELFLQSLPLIQQDLKELQGEWEMVMQKASVENPWFTPPFTKKALHTLATTLFDKSVIEEWLSRYPIHSGDTKRIGLILAGNIPLVGMHDIFCVIASGNRAVIKLSEKDSILIPYLISRWAQYWDKLNDQIEFVEKVNDLDAIIATGTDASARHFEYYFRNIPRLLRKNRNSVAVLNGQEREVELSGLMEDVFLYFGLGCRNVSQVLVPKGYDFTLWNDLIAPWDHLGDHHKYKNNLDYNYALYIINQRPHIFFKPLIIVEDQSVSSRIGSLHYMTYESDKDIDQQLKKYSSSIQCIISAGELSGWDTIPPGQSQSPTVDKYADGIDTMAFLAELS